MRSLEVLLTPLELAAGPEPGTVYLVVDALRATSTIAHALAAGAAAVLPFDSAYASEMFAQSLAPGTYLKAHEADCLKQEGADLGNSPAEYTADVVEGRRILMVTSNGAPLLKTLEGAEQVVAFSFGTVAAVARYLSALDARGVVVCAGHEGAFALEDALAAGALAERLAAVDPDVELAESARTALGLWEGAAGDWPAALRRTDAARRLFEAGFGADVDTCAALDSLDVVVVGQGLPLSLVAYGRAGLLQTAPAVPPQPAAESDGESAAQSAEASEGAEGGMPDGDHGGTAAEGREAGRAEPPADGPAPAAAEGGAGDEAPPPSEGPADGAEDEVFSPDEFRMSLGEHLEELRRKVIYAVGIVLVSFVVCFLVSQDLVNVLLRPIDRAFTNVAHEDVKREVKKKGEAMPAGEELARAVAAKKGSLIVFKPEEVFLGYLKVSLLVGVFLSAPFWMGQLWSFVAKGLYPGERVYIWLFAPAVYIFFSGGVLFLYFVLLPIGLGFLLGFGEHELFSRTVAFGSYMNFCLLLALLMGLVFQLPLVMLFLARVGIVRPETFSGKRRYVILAMFIGAALITPPDVVTQVILALPLLALYEFGLILAKVAYKRRAAS